MFETFNVKGLYLGVQATLALYAQIVGPQNQNPGDLTNLSSEVLTGLVIDSGEGQTTVFPVCDGAIIGSCVKTLPLAGEHITQYVQNALKERGEMVTGGLNEVAQAVKEAHCYCCKDPLKEFAKYDEKTKNSQGVW